MSHPELEAYLESNSNLPLFLRIPDKDSDRYEEIQRENDGEGYLNFQMILFRMKKKKYGSGLNNVKENLIINHTRNIFRMCKRYFSRDEASMKLCKILETFFENELAIISNQKGTNSKSKNGEAAGEEAGHKKQKDAHDLRRSSSQDEYGDNASGNDYQARSVSSKSRKKKDKKDKKKDKKDKKKKNKDKDNKKDHDNQKKAAKVQLENVNSDEEEEAEDDDSQFESKQQLFEIITTRLTIEQKKGIIPIVFQDDGNKKQKFEFDLFSLEPVVFKRLEEYVQNCLSTNNTQFKNSNFTPPNKQEFNAMQP